MNQILMDRMFAHEGNTFNTPNPVTSKLHKLTSYEGYTILSYEGKGGWTVKVPTLGIVERSTSKHRAIRWAKNRIDEHLK